MKLKIVNILFTILSSVALSSCIFDNGSDCPDIHDPAEVSDGDVYLNLTVGVLNDAVDPQSRASRTPADDETYFEGPDSRYEKIKTLRVIIIRGAQNKDENENGDNLQTNIPYLPEANGEIEHNRLFTFSDDGGVLFDNLVFKVHSGEDKRIYLLANEAFVKENAGVDFDLLKEGTKYSAYDNEEGGYIERITLTADNDHILINNSDAGNGTFIPMSEVFDFNVPFQSRPAGQPFIEQIDKKFFITRSAVKFTFSIAAVNGGMPPTNSSATFENYYVTDVVFNQIADKEYFLPRETEYDPAKDETSTNDLNGRYITKYDIPGDATHKVYTFRGAAVPPANSENFIPRNKDYPLVWSVPYYFCESKYNPDTTNPYSVYITVKAKDKEGKWIEGSEYTFEAEPLRNLPLLPRNTHVKVVMNIWKYDVQAVVTLVPYIGVDLRPSFGF